MKVSKVLGIAVFALSIVSCNQQFNTNKSIQTEVDSVSYAIGVDMANKIKLNFEEMDSELFIQGYLNGKDSTNLLMPTKDINRVIRTFFQKQQQERIKKQQEEATKKAEKEFGHIKIEGEKFLAENKNKKGIVTTASGLQYQVLKQGKGEIAKITDKVKLHYHGTLIDGTVFDSSKERKTPITHNVNAFVKGFTEGLQLMKVGSKYKLFIPQELGYGATPRAGKIKPFAPIIFEVELLEIIK